MPEEQKRQAEKISAEMNKLTPEQKEANRQAARRVAWRILENAAAEGRLPAASN